jgi:uncharacterized integral membrane protein (TIGR00698 family)
MDFRLNIFSKLSKRGLKLEEVIFFFALLICVTPLISPPIALLMGLLLANVIRHPFLHRNHKVTCLLLKISVIGLGFGMNVHSTLATSKQGLSFIIVSILGTLILGALLGKWMKVEKKTSHLISCGTAICGGSAIAAISQVIKAEEKQISVALGTIFILNTIALFLFPAIGHWLDLSQKQFGLWSAIAIHDTSSVVGAASKYGEEALQVATTVKLARALWIIPAALLTAVIFKNKFGTIQIPYFIGLFILAMIVNTYIPQTAIVAPYLVSLAKTGLTVTLFLIGSGLSGKALKSVGIRPLLHGVLLWASISVAALYAVIHLA